MADPNRGGRKVVANISLSLDGRVNGAAGDADMSWIVPHAISDGAREHMIRVTSPATTAVLGRKNYQGFAGYWPSLASVAEDESADPRDRTFSRWLNSVEKIVFSSTLHDAQWSNSRVVNADPAMVVRGLRQQDGGDIIVLASSSVIRSLMQSDELDRLSVMLCPEVVGGGARLLDGGLPHSHWTLAELTTSASGAINLFYGWSHAIA